MVVQAQEEMGEGSVMPTDPHHTPIITQPSSSQPQRKQKSRSSKRKDTEVPQPSDPTNVADEDVNKEPSMKLKELIDFCTKLQQRGRKIHDIDADEDITLENVRDDDNGLSRMIYMVLETAKRRRQEELTIDEKATLFQQLLEKRRKHFAAKRAEEKRNRPPTRAQQRSIMCTYLKNMSGWKPKDLTSKSFANIQELFDKAFKRVKQPEFFFKAEIAQESSSKRAKDELEQENAKKQKVDDDQEVVKMKELMKIVLNEEEVAVDAIPLATKPPSIVDYKIVKEGKISYYQIIRADGSSKRYSAFIQMLRSFDREDLETLWKLVKAKHGYTRP
ncbi:hypothetical protein Tco_0906511 [Tanacetum coccineum]|uniref:Uncharacterized protein n=1 Tax=Tanacetum coccineum TaxID=301880 RepID=A0ABQ5CK22_9ASTR